MQVLNEIVSSSGADVVVSSTWRHGKTVAELQTILDTGGFVGRVVDKTPSDIPGVGRGEEIAAWLADHAVDAYVIIDDHGGMGELGDRLLLTQPGYGLRPADVARALALFTNHV